MTDSSEIRSHLATIEAQFQQRARAADSEQELRNIRASVLGKKGELTRLLRRMGGIPAEERRSVGAQVNAVKSAVEEFFSLRLAALRKTERERELVEQRFDLTLPGRLPMPRGHIHPITRIKYQILDIFSSLGFEVAWGPQVDSKENNFEKLAFPEDHPATDMQDSFWVDVTGAQQNTEMLLRTHTSTVQVREMSTRSPPMAVVSGGAVYRRDDDVTHSPMFHQIEGFLVDEQVSFAQLKGVLTEFAQRLYGPDTSVRFRPSYFPFVEPGAEVDVSCVFCSPDNGTRANCRVCKATGWLEILGCGMIHPEVFRHCGIDAEKYSGFAFGLGVERVAMLRYQIPDIRLLFDNDPRFLAQF